MRSVWICTLYVMSMRFVLFINVFDSKSGNHLARMDTSLSDV